MSDKYKYIYGDQVVVPGCAHFVAVETFVNLQGKVPVAISQFEGALDTPFVMPAFLPTDLEAKAVIHSLPICDIINNQYVPSFAAYFITYYSTEPEKLWQRRRDDSANTASDSEYYGGVLSTTYEAAKHPDWFDLSLWIERGQLTWLDPSDPSLSLRSGSSKEFPYKNIRGYRRSFSIANGKVTLV